MEGKKERKINGMREREKGRKKSMQGRWNEERKQGTKEKGRMDGRKDRKKEGKLIEGIGKR